MRKWILFFSITVSLLACEKSDLKVFSDLSPTVPGNPDTDFNLKILDGYFITSIAFDSRGNAWIGTFDKGLIRYNSTETVVYNSSNSAYPVNSVIWDVAVDSRDNVWIGTAGLVKFDGLNFTLYNSVNTSIPEDFVYSLAIDSKDNIWFTSCRFKEGGIVKYDGSTWNVFTPGNSGLPVNLVQSITVDKDDNVWLALSEIVTQTYLVRISGDRWTNYTSDDLGFTPYYFGNIQFNSRNQLCGAIDYSLSSLGVLTGPQVFIFNGATSRQLNFDNMSRIKSLTVDNQDNIWCLAADGFAVYNGVKWTIDNSNFKDHGIFSIEQSPDKKIWIGTGDGIYINNQK